MRQCRLEAWPLLLPDNISTPTSHYNRANSANNTIQFNPQRVGAAWCVLRGSLGVSGALITKHYLSITWPTYNGRLQRVIIKVNHGLSVRSGGLGVKAEGHWTVTVGSNWQFQPIRMTISQCDYTVATPMSKGRYTHLCC